MEELDATITYTCPNTTEQVTKNLTEFDVIAYGSYEGSAYVEEISRYCECGKEHKMRFRK